MPIQSPHNMWVCIGHKIYMCVCMGCHGLWQHNHMGLIYMCVCVYFHKREKENKSGVSACFDPRDIHNTLWTNNVWLRMAIERGRAKGWGLCLCLAELSCLIFTLSYTIGKFFLSRPHPLGLRKAPSHPVKLYFLLICSTTITIFLIKHISLIKIYLKLQLNLSY